jgi:hypothetical protein
MPGTLRAVVCMSDVCFGGDVASLRFGHEALRFFYYSLGKARHGGSRWICLLESVSRLGSRGAVGGIVRLSWASGG